MPLSKEERKQFQSVQRALNKVKMSRNIKAYTIGDDDIIVYDADKYEDYISKYGEAGPDVCQNVDASDAQLFRLVFPFIVESTSG